MKKDFMLINMKVYHGFNLKMNMVVNFYRRNGEEIFQMIVDETKNNSIDEVCAEPLQKNYVTTKNDVFYMDSN